MEHGKHEGCKDVFAALSEYLDAELAPRTCEELEAHLAGCPPCIEFLNSLRRSVQVCRQCGPAEAPPPLTAEQKDKLRSMYQAYLAGEKKGSDSSAP